MEFINSYDLTKRICDCLSDKKNEDDRKQTESTLYDEISQIGNDSFLKLTLLKLCEKIEEIKV